IVHVHSDYATGIACTRQDIPAFHYMVARAGGDSIRCAEYATFGTDALSQNAVKALQGRNACLLANHGMIALGESIDSAYKLAEEIENIAKQYCISKQLGEVVLLDSDEMKINLEKFKTYGKQ
ncbi:MAG: class II aldolase/adducin family protein, partial [Gammaproteobacteria bacterium]|nr:class II aldolase/adducin family protein [Gammaproteobacteria bacterium]